MVKKAKAVKVRINEAVAKKVLATVDAGLVNGVGNPMPGQMCVESAVAFAMGESHHDHPDCVTFAIANTKISINDHELWPDIWDDKNVEKRRAKMLRRLAIAQLGSRDKISDVQWNTEIDNYANKHSPEVLKEWNICMSRINAALKNLEAMKDVDSHLEWEPTTFDNYLDSIETEKALAKICEDLVQILIKLKSPGTKYLYLTIKPKPIKKTKTKRVVVGVVTQRRRK